MLETHHKTRIVFISFFITVSGWWAWNAFLASFYSDNLTPYDVKHGFTHGFGKDPVWWLVLVATLGVLFVVEVAWKAIRRIFVQGCFGATWQPRRRRRGLQCGDCKAEGLVELDVWQEMQREPAMREKLKALARDGSAGEVDELESE